MLTLYQISLSLQLTQLSRFSSQAGEKKFLRKVFYKSTQRRELFEENFKKWSLQLRFRHAKMMKTDQKWAPLIRKSQLNGHRTNTLIGRLSIRKPCSTRRLSHPTFFAALLQHSSIPDTSKTLLLLRKKHPKLLSPEQRRSKVRHLLMMTSMMTSKTISVRAPLRPRPCYPNHLLHIAHQLRKLVHEIRRDLPPPLIWRTTREELELFGKLLSRNSLLVIFVTLP